MFKKQYNGAGCLHIVTVISNVSLKNVCFQLPVDSVALISNRLHRPVRPGLNKTILLPTKNCGSGTDENRLGQSVSITDILQLVSVSTQ